MSDIENTDILAKWSSGELSEQERTELEDLVDLKDLKVVLADIDTWTRPKHNIESGFKAVQEKILNRKASSKVAGWGPWLYAAASVVIIIGVYFAFQFGNPTSDIIHLSTLAGEELEHTLPNGSTIQLDALSSIQYDKASWSEDRSIELTGQALFKVTKGDFHVETNYGKIDVLGTQFNVKTGPNSLAVSCYEGKVRVSAAEQTIDLGVNESVQIINGVLTSDNKTDISPGWVRGVTAFQSSKLIEVITALNSRYSVAIELPAHHHKTEFTGHFVNNDQDLALQMVFGPMGIKYVLNANGEVSF